MKAHKWLTFLLFIFLSIAIFAQKNEVKVMYSPVSLHRMDNWGRDLDGLKAKYAGAFIAEYNRYVKPRLKLGINIAYDHQKASGTKSDGYINPHPPWDWISTTYQQTNKEGWFFFGPQIGYEYIQKESFRMGSLVGVSMVLINNENTIKGVFTDKWNDINFFFHAEVINFTWGKNYGLTGQLGFGHKGLVGFGGFARW